MNQEPNTHAQRAAAEIQSHGSIPTHIEAPPSLSEVCQTIENNQAQLAGAVENLGESMQRILGALPAHCVRTNQVEGKVPPPMSIRERLINAAGEQQEQMRLISSLIEQLEMKG